eukprot:g4751.t1
MTTTEAVLEAIPEPESLDPKEEQESPVNQSVITVPPEDSPVNQSAITVPLEDSPVKNSISTVPPEEGPVNHSAIIVPHEEDPHESESFSIHQAIPDTVLEAVPDAPSFPASLTSPVSEMAPDPIKFQIVVTSPVKETGNRILPGIKSSYFTYSIKTQTSMNHFSQDGVAVRRRFREFVDLANLLSMNFCGFFIPPCPPKNWYQSKVVMSRSFINERQILLQKYLQKLMDHPRISTSEELKVFLETKGKLSETEAWRQLHEQGPTLIQGTKKVMRQISGRERITPDANEISKPGIIRGNFVWTIKGSLSRLNSHRTQISCSDQELKLREERKRLEGFKLDVESMWKRANVWIKASEDLMQTCNFLAIQFNNLTRFETDARYLKLETPAVIARGVNLASLVYYQCSQKSMKPMIIIHNYVELMTSVLAALKSRERALNNVQLVEEVISKKTSKLEQLQHQSSNSEKAQKLADDIEQDKRSLEEARRFYESVAIANTNETIRFRTIRAEDWMKMIKEIVQIQYDCYLRLSGIWTAISEELGADPNEVTVIKAITNKQYKRVDVE